MPSDQEILDVAEDWKKRGNAAFQKSNIEEAIQAYSNGVVQVDRLVSATQESSVLKVALLSNRAACLLKTPKVDECIDDCTLALQTIGQFNIDSKLRSKILFRRAKGRFIRSNIPFKRHTGSGTGVGGDENDGDDLQLAAKDLLTLLSFDSTNKDATHLLQTIRAQHAVESKNNVSNTPLAKTYESMKKKDDKSLHHAKILLGFMTNDTVSASMELGRLGGVQEILTNFTADESIDAKLRAITIQCISCAASYPKFCRDYLTTENFQSKLADIIIKTSQNEDDDDTTVGALAILLRLMLHLDRDVEPKEIENKDAFKRTADEYGVISDTNLEYDVIVKALIAAFNSENIKVIRAGLDVLSTWCAGTDRENIIRASLVDMHVVDIPPPKTLEETRQMAPKILNRHRQRVFHQKKRDKKWACDRAVSFQKEGGLEVLLQCSVKTDDSPLRREITATLGKVLSGLVDEDTDDDLDTIQSATVDILGGKKSPKIKEEKDKDKNKKKEENLGVVIEEIDDDDDDEEGKVVDVTEKNDDDDKKMRPPATFEDMKQRAELAAAMLLANAECGQWALGTGWPTCRENLDVLVTSQDKIARCLVAELMTAAASVKETRPYVATMVKPQALKDLVGNEDPDIRTAAASAITKIGLAEKGAAEGEVIGLMEAACWMLEDGDESSDENADGKSKSKTTDFLSRIPEGSELGNNANATTSVERGVEVFAYLVSKTQVKEEIAHGFQGKKDSKKTALELLVDIADSPNAGERLTAYGLVSIFSHMSVTAFQLRKKAFDGKPVTMEQYDEIQSMAKTEEEKDMQDDSEVHDGDNDQQCAERIRKMTQANVPRALIQLSQGATERTLEGVVTALNQMSGETSVRGKMIQQGVLTGLIKIDKEEKAPSDTKKKLLRVSRHCMAKMLISMNPGLLTAAQRMGAVKPLILLVRDVHSTDLQQFEALMALTNLASTDDTKSKIIAEKGISSFNFAMFSEHEMVKQAATEAMCNLVPHEKMLEHLRKVDTLRLWLALASDYEEGYETARAAAGGLAMSTQDEQIATTLISIQNFKERVDSILECGRLELMHRILVVLLNLAEAGGKFKDALMEHGFYAFSLAYVQSYHDGSKATELEFSEEDMGLFRVTVSVAQQIVTACDTN